MSLRTSLKALALLGALITAGSARAKAQDWSDYLHWPYVPPQVPGNGFQYTALNDKFFVYPRDQRIVPQIQGPYYKNFYGGQRVHGFHRNFGDINRRKFYYGYHYTLDVF